MLERKAAGKTAEARIVAKRKFAMLHDSWWDRRADQLRCAADTGNISSSGRSVFPHEERPSACQ